MRHSGSVMSLRQARLYLVQVPANKLEFFA